MRRQQQRSARSLIAAARLDADEAVLHQINAANRVACRQFRSAARPAATGSSLTPFTATGVPVSNPIVTLSSRSGASCGEFVSCHVVASGALVGSSSSPPSWLTCQMLRSRLWIFSRLARYGNSALLRRSRGSLRATSDVHSRHGAITFKLRRQRLIGVFETHLVIALAGAAMRDRGRAFFRAQLPPGASRSPAAPATCPADTCAHTPRPRAARGRRSRVRNSSRRSSTITLVAPVL